MLGALALAPLAACSSENVDCTVNECTVTFERGVDAEASVLGVDVKLVGVQGDQVTIDIAGTEVNVPVNGETDAEGFNISVEEVTDSKVVVKISNA
jgi:hypothetical protein